MRNFGFILVCLVACLNASAQCDTLDLGNDFVLCQGASAQLNAGPGYNFYSWSTGQSSQFINANTAGTYTVDVGVVGANLILYGDFQGGTTSTANNFTTSYAPGSGGSWGLLSTEGQFAIATSPSLTHNNFVACADHTTGTGNMYVANGSSIPGTIVWSQTVNVTPASDYLFSFWATNVVNDPNVSQLQLFINGSPIGNVNATSVTPCSWGEISDVWNSGASTQAILSIVNNSTVVGGNDFAIDDILFAPICLDSDTITVTVDTIGVNAGPDLTFCANDTESLLAVSNDPNATFLWSNNVPQAGFTPTTSGLYSVTATSANGCTASDNVNVNVIPVNWGIDSVGSNPTACGSNNGYVFVLMEGTFDAPPVYAWNGPGAGNPNQVNASVFQNLSPGWYYLSIESNGCYMYDSMEVLVSNPPVASGTANPTLGVAPLSVDFTNSSQNATSYDWDFGNGQTLNTTSLANQNQVYTTSGVYNASLIAYQGGGCSDTVYFTIVVTDPPVPPVIVPFSIEIPNVFTPNGDGTNDFFEMDVLNPADFQVVLLNRWGIVMYESNDPAFQWDGTSNGVNVDEGVYFYKCTVHDMQGELIEKHGFFHLER